MANRFLERLATGPPLVADGGMGVLVSSAAPRVRIPEEANLRAPETVVKLHVGFIQAGADVIETNTFGANRRKLAAHYLEDELQEINSAAVKLARDAREMAGRDVFIAGSIGPLGERGVAKQRTPGDLRRAGVGARGPRRRLLLRGDVLRARGARGGDRGRAQRVLPARSWRC